MVVEVVWWCGGDVVKKMNSKKGDAVRCHEKLKVNLRIFLIRHNPYFNMVIY